MIPYLVLRRHTYAANSTTMTATRRITTTAKIMMPIVVEDSPSATPAVTVIEIYDSKLNFSQ